MPVTDDDLAMIQQRVAAAVGRTAWGLTLGKFDDFRFDLGASLPPRSAGAGHGSPDQHTLEIGPGTSWSYRRLGVPDDGQGRPSGDP